MRKRLILLCMSAGVLCLTGTLAMAQEDEETSSSGTNWKQEISSDKQGVQEQRAEIKENAQASRQEEKNLRDQIHQAMQSGDYETAKQLRQQLHEVHQGNIQQRQQDMEDLQSSRQELKEDFKGAREEKGGRPPRRGPVGEQPPSGQVSSGEGTPGPQGPEGGYRHRPPREFREGPRDLREDRRDRREDVRDRQEDRWDKREDIRDRKEDVRDRREDAWDARHNPPKGTEAWKRDKMEDIRDRREDVVDRREDKRDHKEDRIDRREDRRDRHEDVRDRKEDVRDKRHHSGGPAKKGSPKSMSGKNDKNPNKYKPVE